MSTTRLQEVQICFGFGKQTDIATANLVAAMWRLKKLNAQLANPKLNTENDAEEYGKGHEFATTTFKTSWDTGGTLEKYLSAEMAAWAMCFGLGKVVKSGSAGFSNTIAARQRSEKRRATVDRVLPGRIALPAVDGCRCEADAGLAMVLVAHLVAAVGSAVAQRRSHCGRIHLVDVDGMRPRRR